MEKMPLIGRVLKYFIKDLVEEPDERGHLFSFSKNAESSGSNFRDIHSAKTGLHNAVNTLNHLPKKTPTTAGRSWICPHESCCHYKHYSRQ
jgi:hypothetical protein